MTFRLNYKVAPETVLVRANDGDLFIEIPVEGVMPWWDPWYGWQLQVVGRENDGRTLVLEAIEPSRS